MSSQKESDVRGTTSVTATSVLGTAKVKKGEVLCSRFHSQQGHTAPGS